MVLTHFDYGLRRRVLSDRAVLRVPVLVRLNPRSWLVLFGVRVVLLGYNLLSLLLGASIHLVLVAELIAFFMLQHRVRLVLSLQRAQLCLLGRRLHLR